MGSILSISQLCLFLFLVLYLYPPTVAVTSYTTAVNCHRSAVSTIDSGGMAEKDLGSICSNLVQLIEQLQQRQQNAPIEQTSSSSSRRSSFPSAAAGVGAIASSSRTETTLVQPPSMSQVVPFGATRSSSLRTLRQELFKTKNSSDVDRKGKRRRLQSEEWCVTFVCLASKSRTVVPDCGAKAALKLAGLGEKKVTLSKVYGTRQS